MRRNRRTARPLRRASSAGFTMLELVLVLVILAVVAGIAAEPLRQSLLAAFGTRQLADVQGELHSALDHIAREIRSSSNAECLAADELEVERGGGGSVLVFSLEGSRLVVAADGEESVTLIGGDDFAVGTFDCVTANDQGPDGDWGWDDTSAESHAERLFRITIETEDGFRARNHVFAR